MVVRLGVQEWSTLSSRYRILQGQQVHLQYVSSSTATIRAWARIRYDSGVDATLYIPDQVMVGDRSVQFLTPSEVAVADGWVTDAVVECVSDGVKRGQAYVKLLVALESRAFGTLLCSDYVFSSTGQVALGTYTQPGPGGGSGDLEWVIVKANGAPVASTSYSLALSNTIRRIHGFIHYYVCSADVASRVLSVRLTDPGGALPTGSGDIYVWAGVDTTLTASQRGAVFADVKRGGANDDQTITIQDAGTNPSPFPMVVEENDLASMDFNVALGEVLDFDVVYAQIETWLVL